MTAEPHNFFYSSIDGLRLFCRVYPAACRTAVPLLCLPGLTRNSRDFAQMAQRLSEHRDVFAADLRGRGSSQWDRDPSHYQLIHYVADAWTLLEALRVQRVIVIGTSLGALMAMVMAAARPAALAGIVLNDAGPELDPRGLRRIATYAGKLPPIASWLEAAEQAKSVYGTALPDLSAAEWLSYARAGYREDASGRPIADMDPAIADAFIQSIQAPADLWAIYAQITDVPLLVIRGTHSDILSEATVERMVREKPDLRHVNVPNRGHTPTLNEPECAVAIDAFLEQINLRECSQR